MGTYDASSVINGRENKRLGEEGNHLSRVDTSRSDNAKRRHLLQDASSRNEYSISETGKCYNAEGNLAPVGNKYLSALLQSDISENLDVIIYQIVKNVACGHIAADDAAKALQEKFHGYPANSAASYRLLDCIGFAMDLFTNKSTIEGFLLALENVGIVSAREIVAAIDSHKLDDCGYTTGLTTIAIRERTRKQFVLMSYSLWRECGVGYNILYQVMYGQSWNSADPHEMMRLGNHVKSISGKYSLCPMRVLYELIAWCAVNEGEASVLILQKYPNKSVEDMLCLMLSQCHSLKRSYQNSKKQYWKIPKTLGNYFFRACALLIVSRLMGLGRIYRYLDPPDSRLTGLVTHFMRVARTDPLKLERGDPPVTYLTSIANCSSGEVNLRQTLNAIKKPHGKCYGILDSTSIHNARDFINKRHAKLLEQATRKSENGFSVSRSLESLCSSPDSMSQSTSSSSQYATPKSVTATNSDDGSKSRSSKVGASPETFDAVMYEFLETDGYAHVRDHIFALDCDKFSLLKHLIDLCTDLECQAWKVAKQVLAHLHATVNFPIILHGNISLSMCQLICRVITKGLTTENLDTCVSQIVEILEMTGPILYLNMVSFSKVLKLLERCLDKHTDVVCKVIWKHLFPSMALMIEGSCQPSARLWRILSMLPASKRYCIYYMYMTKVLKNVTSQDVAWIHLVKNAHVGVLSRTRSIIKRVTSSLLKAAKSASVRSYVSAVSGLSSIDPFAVSHTIISQCEMFENLVLPLSEIGKYFGYMTCDIFFFILNMGQTDVCFSDSSERDDIGLGKRLSVDAQLAARFFRRHSHVDICPLLVGTIIILLRSMMIQSVDIQIISDEASNEDQGPKHSFALKPIKTKSIWTYPHDISGAWLVLEYICKLMELAGGVPQLAEAHALTADQLHAQAGGVHLRSEIMTQDAEDDMCGNSSREVLAKAILKPLFCNGFLMLAGKMRLEVLYDSDYRKNVMSLCATVDRLQKIALQLSEFKENTDAILHRVDSSHATKLPFELPSFDNLSRFWEDGMALYLVTTASNGNKVNDIERLLKGQFNPEFLKFVFGIHLSDIWVPTEQYNKMLNKLSEWVKDGSSSHYSGSHRRVKKLKARYATLEREMKQQTENVELTKERFAEVLSKDWLKPDAQIGQPITIAFLKQCIAPRILVNEAEAAFCGRIVDIMLANRLQYFNFFDFCNCWTKMLMSYVRCCTEREAPLLAIFVSHVFSIIKYWCYHPQEFEEMAKSHPCYGTTFRFVPEKALTHKQLMTGTRKWELRVLRALSGAIPLKLTETEPHAGKADRKVLKPTWIDQKSAVVFLARCHENFPITAHAGRTLLSGLQRLTEEVQDNGWKDVYVAASTILKTFEKYDREVKWHQESK